MTKQRKKRKRRTSATQAGETAAQSGGVMQSLRSGFRRATGVEASKPSRGSNIVWTIILLVAVGILLYRWYG
jgi:hypothetical protein